MQVRTDADKKDTEAARVISEAAEALIQLNLALIVYSDLRTCDALCVLEDHFSLASRGSVFCQVYSAHCDHLREIVHDSVAVEDNPKLLKLYELLLQLYSMDDARGIQQICEDFVDRLLMIT